MTDYPTRSSAWRRREIQRKWRGLVAVFITVVFLFALLNGFVKTFSIKKYLGDSSWDGRVAFVAALMTDPVSVLVYQTDPARIGVFKLSDERYLATGDTRVPLVKISEIVERKDGRHLSKVLTLAFGADIEKYLIPAQRQSLNEDNANELFKKFASPATPFLVLTGRFNQNIGQTNITRFDLIKLWWQLKGLSIDRLQIVDLSPYKEEVIGAGDQKVLGIDEVSLHMQIAKFMENRKISEGNFKVKVQNASDSGAAGKLAAEFVSAVGFSVVDVKGQSVAIDKSLVQSKDKNSYAASYLAKIFNCDIKAMSKEAGSELTVIIGRDFANRYFQ